MAPVRWTRKDRRRHPSRNVGTQRPQGTFRGGGARKGCSGALEVDRSQALQFPPHTSAQACRFARDAVDQNQPVRFLVIARLVVCLCGHFLTMPRGVEKGKIPQEIPAGWARILSEYWIAPVNRDFPVPFLLGYLPNDATVPSKRAAWAFGYLAVWRLLELVVLLIRSDEVNEIELLALRHEVLLLRRQVKRQSFKPADRALLAVLSRLLPRSRWACFGVTPATPCLAPPTGGSALDLPASLTGAPQCGQGDHGPRGAPGQGEPPVGLPAYPGRASEARGPSGSQHCLPNPLHPPPRTGTSPGRNLAGVRSCAGGSHRGHRLLQRGHGAVAASLRLVLHRRGPQKNLDHRCDRPPEHALGDPTGDKRDRRTR